MSGVYINEIVIETEKKEVAYDLIESLEKKCSADNIEESTKDDKAIIKCSTNYSYELEYTVYGDKFTENRLKSIQRYLGERAEPKYMLQTFNQVNYEGKDIDIWHIHGEARKPDSMIIGSDYYSRLTSRVINVASSQDYDAKDGKDINKVTIKNWVEAMLLGDIYVLGFGYDYSEQDLWWLLNRKANETKLLRGKTYYYEPTAKSCRRQKLVVF